MEDRLSPSALKSNAPSGAMGRRFLSSFYIIFIFLGMTHLTTGLADNHDFRRNTECLFERPSNTSDQSADPSHPDYHRRFYAQWNDQWLVSAGECQPEIVTAFSPYRVYLKFQIYVSQLLTENQATYSTIAGSLTTRALYFAGLLLILSQFQARLSLTTFVISAALLLVVSMDASFCSFFNSFYEEQLGIALLPILAFCLYAYFRAPGRALLLCIMFMATIIGSSKTAFFLLPSVIAGCLWLSLRGFWAVRVFPAVALSCQLTAFLPIAFGEFTQLNQYHAVYYGVLKAVPQEQRSSVTSPNDTTIFPQCIGQSAFEPATCFGKVRATYLDAAALLIARPMVAGYTFTTLMREGAHIRPDLSMSLGAGHEANPIRLFSLWESAYRLGLNVLALALLGAGAVTLIVRRQPDPANSAFLKTAMCLAFAGGSLYAAALGDGFFEIHRHLALANFCLSIALVFFLPGFVMFFRRRAVAKRMAHQAPPPPQLEWFR